MQKNTNSNFAGNMKKRKKTISNFVGYIINITEKNLNKKPAKKCKKIQTVILQATYKKEHNQYFCR
jgi:hypothetical protein